MCDMRMRIHICHGAQVGSEDKSVEFILSFHIYMGSGDTIQAAGLAQQEPLSIEPFHWPRKKSNIYLYDYRPIKKLGKLRLKPKHHGVNQTPA